MHINRKIVLLGLVATLGTTPAVAADKCVNAIAAALAKAAKKNFQAALKGQPATATIDSSKLTKACAAATAPGGYTGCPGLSGCTADTDTSFASYQTCVNCTLKEIANDLPRRTVPALCGNGTKDAREECDPAAAESGCGVGSVCSSAGASACSCTPPCPGFSSFEFTIGQGASSCGGFCSGNATRTCFSDAGCAAEDGGNLGTCAGKACSFSFTPCTMDSDCVDSAAGEVCATNTPTPDGDKSGELTYSDNSTGNLGKGCLYFGGGGNRITPPAPIPDGSTIPFAALCPGGSVNLQASAGTGPAQCSRGVATAKHCLNGDAGTDGQGACNADTDCGGDPNTCGPDARCYFGPPLPISGGPAPTCLLNVFSEDASGTIDPATGEASININLFTRIYAQGPTRRCHNGAAGNPVYTSPGQCDLDADCGGDVGSCKLALPCPTCVNDKCIGGARHGQSCTAVGSKGTTLDCPLLTNSDNAAFLSTLSVQLGPLTTGTSTRSADANGNFCGDTQINPGAFGQGLTQGSLKVTSMSETGSAPGDLRDLAAHTGVLGYTFCIPATGTFVDNIAALPGPGAVSLVGTFQLK